MAVGGQRVDIMLLSNDAGLTWQQLSSPGKGLRVLDAAGVVLLESGRLNASGQVVSQAGSPLPFEAPHGPLSPHIDIVDSDQQALVYEQVPGDSTGAPTTSLLASEQMLKDNRLLPRGLG
jgi:hypothetical protein